MDLDPESRLIVTTPEIDGHGPWTRARLAENLFLAEAYGRPIGMETVRAIAFSLIQDDLEAAQDASPADAGEVTHDARPVLDLALSGALTDLDTLWASVAALGPRSRDALTFASHVGALEAFFESVPAGHHVWVNRPGRRSGWVCLDRSEDEIRVEFGRGAVGIVLGSTGFGPLSEIDTTCHEASLRSHRDEEFDAEDPSLGDVWAWHRLATGLRLHGPAYAAWVRAEDGAVMRNCPFDLTYVGPVDSREAFCFNIGVRDGWWLPAESLSHDHDLRAVLSVDTEAMWRLYEIIGWAIAPGVCGEDTAYLFKPIGHVGPPPSVAQVRATRRY